MKKTAILLVAAVLTVTLAACGSRNNTAPVNDRYDEGYDKGYQDGYDDARRELENRPAADDGAVDGGTVGSDLENAADDVGDAVGDVGDAVGDVGDAVGDAVTGNTGANATGFQRMLDNARVHDTDGDLTDGENPAR